MNGTQGFLAGAMSNWLLKVKEKCREVPQGRLKLNESSPKRSPHRRQPEQHRRCGVIEEQLKAIKGFLRISAKARSRLESTGLLAVAALASAEFIQAIVPQALT